MPGKVGIVATISGVRASKNRKKASKKSKNAKHDSKSEGEKVQKLSIILDFFFHLFFFN